MDLKAQNIIGEISDILNAQYVKYPDFSDQREKWAFFVSQPVLITLKKAAGKFLHLDIIDRLIDEVTLEILGYEIFGVHGLEDNVICFSKKYKMKKVEIRVPLRKED